MTVWTKVDGVWMKSGYDTWQKIDGVWTQTMAPASSARAEPKPKREPRKPRQKSRTEPRQKPRQRHWIKGRWVTFGPWSPARRARFEDERLRRRLEIVAFISALAMSTKTTESSFPGAAAPDPASGHGYTREEDCDTC